MIDADLDDERDHALLGREVGGDGRGVGKLGLGHRATIEPGNWGGVKLLLATPTLFCLFWDGIGR